MKHGKLRKVGL